MQATIRQMRAFDAVVRAGSFAAAAQALHISPAAVSLAIRELEQTLGFQVLQRTTRSVRLTDNGRGYLSFVQRVLGEFDGAQRFAADVQRGRSIVRIATTQTIIACLLPAVLPQVQARWPDIHVHPLDVAASDIVGALVSRQADLAIGVDLPDDEHFEARPAYTSPWHAFLCARHPLGRRKRLAWADLAGFRLFMTRSASFKLGRALAPGVSLADVQDTTTASSGLAMASTGQGIAVFPGYAHALAGVMGVHAIPIQGPLLVHELYIAVARQGPAPSSLHALRDMLVDSLGRLPMAHRGFAPGAGAGRSQNLLEQ